MPALCIALVFSLVAPAATATAQSGCRLEHQRIVHGNFVQQEQEIDIEVRYAFDCEQRQPRRDIAIVLDVQAFVDAPEDTRSRSDALKDGLGAFLDWIGEEDAPRLALLRSLQDSHTVAVEPTYDLEAVLASIDQLEVHDGDEGMDLPGGFGSAIDTAVEVLGDEAGIDRALLIFDGGMPLQQGPDGPVNPPADACAAAKALGVRLATVSHSSAQRRLASACAAARYFYAPGDEGSPDLRAAFERVGQSVFHPYSAVSLEYADFIKPGFSYVEGSGQPRDPDLIALAERSWQEPVQTLQGTFDLRYKILIDRGTGEVVSPLSSYATVALERIDGEVETWSLNNPALCVHWPTLESFCIDHIRSSGPWRAWLPGLNPFARPAAQWR